MATSTVMNKNYRTAERHIISASEKMSIEPSLPEGDSPATSFLEFVPQTGKPIKDPTIKKLVRKHARNYVSRAKGIQKSQPLLQFRLAVPESFTDETAVRKDGELEELFEGLEGIEALDITDDFGMENLRDMDFSYASQSDELLDVVDEMMLFEPSSDSSGSNWLANDYGSMPSTFKDAVKVVVPPVKSPKVIRERTGKPKSKRGCKSCKQRHLKCDGSKPSCLRCLKSGLKCEGNAAPERLATRVAAPNSFTFELSQYCPSVVLPFVYEDEARYFKLFQDETAAELSGVFPTSFWNQIIPQESHAQDFVRHAIISIAALNRAIKLGNILQQSKDTDLTRHHEAVNQREFALKQYGKALKAMRNISWQEKGHLRKVLIATLLVIVFETMVMQPDLAYQHALIGDRLVCHWLDANPPALPHTEGLTSPVTAAVEDELLMTFGRYDTQLLAFVDHRGVEIHRNGRKLCANTMRSMPTTFAMLGEAAAYWQVVMRRSGHFLLAAAAATESERFERAFMESVRGRVLEMNSSTSIYCSPYTIPDTLEGEKSVHLDDVARWSAAFDPLWLQVCQNETNSQAIVAASILRMYSLSMRILIEGTVFTSELLYDQFLPMFVEIVQLASFIDSNLQPSYHFHLSTAPPLWVVLLRCRDPTIRRDALATLRAIEVDGPWDRRMIANVGEWMMQVEEEGMDEQVGHVEESSRIRLTRLVIGMQEKKVWVQCVRREVSNGEITPKLVWLEKAISDW